MLFSDTRVDLKWLLWYWDTWSCIFLLPFCTSTTAYVLGRSLLMEEFFESGCKNRGVFWSPWWPSCCSTYPDYSLWGVVRKLGAGKNQLHPSLLSFGKCFFWSKLTRCPCVAALSPPQSHQHLWKTYCHITDTGQSSLLGSVWYVAWTLAPAMQPWSKGPVWKCPSPKCLVRL